MDLFGSADRDHVQHDDGNRVSLWDNPQPHAMPTGLAFLVLMMGAPPWSIAAIPAGMGQGMALRERKVVINGVVGAVIGGLVGGLLFDPISLILVTADGKATYSRAVGFAAIGCFVGLFVGWSKAGRKRPGYSCKKAHSPESNSFCTATRRFSAARQRPIFTYSRTMPSSRGMHSLRIAPAGSKSKIARHPMAPM